MEQRKKDIHEKCLLSFEHDKFLQLTFNCRYKTIYLTSATS